MRRADHEEFKAHGIARIAWWTGLLVWFPATGAVMALLFRFSFDLIRQPIDNIDLHVTAGLVFVLSGTFYLVDGAYKVPGGISPWGGRRCYWTASTILYALTGTGLCLALIPLIQSHLASPAAPGLQAWLGPILETSLFLLPALISLAMAYLSGVALRQHLEQADANAVGKEAKP